MHWTVEVTLKPEFPDPLGHEAAGDLAAAGLEGVGEVRTWRIYDIDGDLTREQIERIAREILCDPIVETYQVLPCDSQDKGLKPFAESGATFCTLDIRRKPGVMDPVEASAIKAIRDLGLPVEAVATATRYRIEADAPDEAIEAAAKKALANAIVDDLEPAGQSSHRQADKGGYRFELKTVELLGVDPDGLAAVNRDLGLSLLPVEMLAIQSYFAGQDRNPTDVELQTIAQTWSEHCKHKTVMGPVDFDGEHFDNLLGETIKKATETLDRDWCVSVFSDNAGIVRFEGDTHLCIKVETHNHPSAIEPYGGANTGMGGVIRDTLGAGLGARPILNTDVFCFGPPDLPLDALPPGTLHPRRIMKGVVAGVRDYGNRIGIPTVNGAVYFDERYVGNPLVYCGNVGLIPADKCFKEARPGDRIVAVGGRTGRDGIQGATFSSAPLHDQSEVTSGSAVQIGNAITEKTVADTILQARDEGLYTDITDCGAGGFSSAVGELAEAIGAEVQLEKARLKYTGLSYTEIWISESQERMVIAVPPEKLDRALALFAAEDVEAVVIGSFTDTKRLVLTYEGNEVLNLDMKFLHDGLPKTVRKATWSPPEPVAMRGGARDPALRRKEPADHGDTLKKILGSYNVCSKEWIIRQYDHEVQAGSIVKPLVGIANDGPGDAAVCAPLPGSDRGLALGCGMNPRYGDLDPYAMAASAIDEALRNVVAVGGTPDQCAILDNFCWGDTNKPDRLGSLVLAAKACRDVAIAFGTPFVSGKDSLNNEFVVDGKPITIPPSLLITAMAIVPDVTRAVTMDAKAAGNLIYVIGVTKDEMGGSHHNLVTGATAGTVPQVDLALAPATFRALHGAINARLIRSAHDCSEGGLAVALAEMAFAGGLGITADLTAVLPLPPGEGRGEGTSPATALFSESNSRFVIEIEPGNKQAFEQSMKEIPHLHLGEVATAPRLTLAYAETPVINEEITALKQAWQAPLAW